MNISVFEVIPGSHTSFEISPGDNRIDGFTMD